MLRFCMELWISRGLDEGRPLPGWARWLAARWPSVRRFEREAVRLDAALREGVAEEREDTPPPAAVDSERPPSSFRLHPSRPRPRVWLGAAGGLAAAAAIALAGVLWQGSAGSTGTATHGPVATTTATAPASSDPDDPSEPNEDPLLTASAGWDTVVQQAKSKSHAWQSSVLTVSSWPGQMQSPPALVSTAAEGVRTPLAQEYQALLEDARTFASRVRQSVPLPLEELGDKAGTASRT